MRQEKRWRAASRARQRPSTRLPTDPTSEARPFTRGVTRTTITCPESPTAIGPSAADGLAGGFGSSGTGAGGEASVSVMATVRWSCAPERLRAEIVTLPPGGTGGGGGGKPAWV